MVRETRRSGGRTTYPGEHTPWSTSFSASRSCNGIELRAGPHLEHLRAVASSIMGAANVPLSPRSPGLLVLSTTATRRLPVAQLRRAAAVLEKLHGLIYGPPVAATPADRQTFLDLLFGQRANRVAFMQVLAVAASMLADTDRGLSTEDQERCASLFARAALLVYVLLVTADTQPNAALAVASLLLQLKLLPAFASLLIAARDPERRQAMGRLHEWFRPTFMMADNLLHFVQLIWNSVYDAQPTSPMSPMSLGATFVQLLALSSDPHQHRLILAAELLEAMAQHQYVEQIVRTTVFIIQSPISSDTPTSRCLPILVKCVNQFYLHVGELLQMNQKLKVQNEATIRITTALRTLLSGPNTNYFAVASTVAQLAALDGGTLYGMDPVHAAKLRLHNPNDGPQPQEQESDWVSAFQWSSSFWALCLDHDLPLRLCIHGSECNLSRDVLRELGLRLMRVARRWGQEDRDLARSLDPRWCKIAVNAIRISLRFSRHDLVWLTEPTSPWDDGNIETDIVVASEVWSELVPTAHRVLVLLGQIDEWTRVAVPSWSGTLPPAPPPNLAAALSAGFVPLLERTLRYRADRQRAAPHDLLLAFSNWSRFGRMLAYGERQQLEALLVTGTKLIRRLGTDRVAAAGGGGDPVVVLGRIRDIMLDMRRWITRIATTRSWRAAGGAAASGTSPLCSEPTSSASCHSAVGDDAADDHNGRVASGGGLGVSDSGLRGTGSSATSDPSGPSSGSARSRQQPDDGGPSSNACSGSGPTRQGDSGDRSSCSSTFAAQSLEQDRADGPSTTPREDVGASGSDGSSDVSQRAKDPLPQLLGLIIRVLHLWLPATNSALTHLAARVGTNKREDVLQGWIGVVMWVAPMAVTHALAAGRLPLPDWRPLYSSAVEDQRLRAAGAFCRRLLLVELGVVELVGRMLKLMMQEGDGVVESYPRNVYVCLFFVLSSLVSEFPVEVAAGLRDGTLPRDYLKQLCSLWGQVDQEYTQLICCLKERLDMLGGMSPAEAATAHMPLGHLFPDDFVGRPLGPRSVGEILLLGCLLESVGTPAAWRLPTCGNPACTNLAGDSEAALQLPKKCGKCEQLSYCSGACQWAHWTSGHNEQCAGLQQRPQQGAG